MRIIDVHAHIYPPKIEAKATAAIGSFYDRPKMLHNGSPEELIQSGERAGVTDFLVFSTATTPQQVASINDFIIGQCAQHPEFIGAGTLHIDFAEYENEIDRICAKGLMGVKFHPDFQRFNIDDERLFPMYEKLQAKGMYIITHSGDPRYGFSHPERVANVARNFPKMRVVAAHFGGWMSWDIARGCLRDLENVYYDTSSTYGFGGLEPMKLGMKTFDNTHIFFGCDFPMWDHEFELKTLKMLGLDEKTLQNVLFDNFADFYGHNI